MYTTDQQLPLQAEGQADWDTALNLAMGTLERGYHTTARAGYAVATLDLLWLDSNGFFQKFNVNSSATKAMALAYSAANSGDSLQAMLSGIVRSITVTPGQDYFASPAVPGTFVGSGTSRIGFGVAGGGFYFNPGLTETLISSFYTAAAGAAVNTGYAVTIASDASVSHFDPNVESVYPHGVALNGGTGVGSLINFVLLGEVNSLVSNGPLTPGANYFVSPTTPGLIVTSYSAASRRVGRAITAAKFWLNPAPRSAEFERLTRVVTVTINPTSVHLFSLDVGKAGWMRDVLMKSNSADKVGLSFFSNSARTNLMYQTISGGITTVASFTDRGGWPFENTDAATLSGILYGKIWPDSTATVASQNVQVQLLADRWL